ncbi:MAG: NAD(P)-binding protein [archaeon]
MATSLLEQSEKVIREARMLIILIVGVMLIGIVGLGMSADMSVTGAGVATLKMLAGDKIPVTGVASGVQTFLHLFGAIILWFAVWTAFGLTVEGKFGDVFKEVRTLSQIKGLSGHYIVCGAGRVGKHIGSHLRKSGEKVVFIEKDRDTALRLRSEGFLVVETGPIDSHVLEEAGIANARGIAVSLGDDSRNLLLVLEARELNQK